MKHILRILVVFAGFLCSLGFCSSASAEPDSVQVWRQLTTGVSEPFAHVFVKNADTVYVTSPTMILRTINGGTTWEQLMLAEATGGCIWFMDDTTGIFAAETDTIYKTTNGGKSWRAIHALRDPHYVKQMQFVGRDSGWIRYNDFIARTTDGGENWAESNAYSSCFSFATSHVGYSVTPLPLNAFEKTTDGGVTWARFIPQHDAGTFALFAISPDTLISPCCGDSVAKSIDSGYTWSLHLTGAGPMIFIATAFADHRNGWSASNQIIHTTDAGETWTPQSIPSGIFLHDIATASPEVAYAVGDSGVVLKTTNAGNSWVNVGPGWIPSLNDYVSPSPAVTATSLSYELPSSQRITIGLYSLTGSLVQSLVSNVTQSQGAHEVPIDVSSLPSGLYFYMIEGETCSATGKLVVSH